MVALVLTPVVVDAWGWEWAFYSFGLVGVVWFAVWYFVVARTPQEQKNITEEELAIIAEGTASNVAEESSPWGQLLR